MRSIVCYLWFVEKAEMFLFELKGGIKTSSNFILIGV